MKKRAILAGVVAVSMCSAMVLAESPFEGHPAAAQLEAIFKEGAAPKVKETGVTRGDYLKLVAGDVDFFKGHQDAKGAIIDPFAKREVQYSTPAFALAAGTLVVDADRKDLLEPAIKAMNCSITALVNHKTADAHADFYIPLIMRAYEVLKPVAPAEVVSKWEEDLKKVNAEKAYNASLRGMNWNIVSTSGEVLRRKAGLVAEDQKEAQWKYIETCLKGHEGKFTKYGMYLDPNAPLAYDAFARLWLEGMMVGGEGGAYDGAMKGRIDSFLKTGGLSSLLLLSPSGEWASGGRSAMHQWNEAELMVICEIEAKRWKALGREDVAGAFKRGARLGYQSMMRWVRPTGDLYIVKNRFEPDHRVGFESYSQHTQYNLLAAAMVAMAYTQADETIAETPLPSEWGGEFGGLRGGYVFDMRETFHKVVAGAGGYYVLIDTSADPMYNATGVQRIHRAGVAFSALEDSTAAERTFGPPPAPDSDKVEKRAMSSGLVWKEGGEDVSLASYVLKGKGKREVGEVNLRRMAEGEGVAKFELSYQLGERVLTQSYTVSEDGVGCVETVTGDVSGGVKFGFPVMVFDGVEETGMSFEPGVGRFVVRGCETMWGIIAPMDVGLQVDVSGKPVASHAGWNRWVGGAVREGRAAWQVELKGEKKKS